MKKFLKVIPFFLLLLMITPVKAADGNLYIKANYSANITPQENDTLIITYKLKGGEDTAKITVDASTITENYATVTMPVSSYEVDSIEYVGGNQDVIDEGYGIVSSFVVREDSNTILYIALGENACKSLESTYDNTKIMDGEHDENGEELPSQEGDTRGDSGTTRTTESLTTQNVTHITEVSTEDIDDEEYDEEDEDEDSYTVEAQTNVEEPSVEKYTSEEETTKKETYNWASKIAVGIPILFIAGIGIGVIYFLHKRGVI